MKAVALLLFVAACSGSGDAGSCKNSVVRGTWNEDGGSDVMEFKSDCTGTSSSCGSTFEYPNVTSDDGNVLITVTETDGGAGCLPLGETECSYGIVGSSLAFDCGGGAVSYTKD